MKGWVLASFLTSLSTSCIWRLHPQKLKTPGESVVLRTLDGPQGSCRSAEEGILLFFVSSVPDGSLVWSDERIMLRGIKAPEFA